jgi:hypothetical protein
MAVTTGEQLQFYGVTVSRMSHHLGLPVKLYFAIITKAKTPVVQLLPVPTEPAARKAQCQPAPLTV